MVRGYNAPQNSIPEFLIGRSNQNNPLPQQFTQPRDEATHISPDNTLPKVEQTSRRQNSDGDNPINRLAESNAGIAIQQRPQTSSAFFKPTRTSTLIFGGKKRNLNCSRTFFSRCLKCNLKCQKR